MRHLMNELKMTPSRNGIIRYHRLLLKYAKDITESEGSRWAPASRDSADSSLLQTKCGLSFTFAKFSICEDYTQETMDLQLLCGLLQSFETSPSLMST